MDSSLPCAGKVGTPFLKSSGKGHKAPPEQSGDHILCSSDSSKYRPQSNHTKEANDVLGCSTEQAEDKAAERGLR